MNKVKKISFLPIAKNDLKEIVRYISKELHMPLAAEAIYVEIVKHIDTLATFPLAYREYEPSNLLSDKYRIMPVKKYVVLYVVYDDIVEIRRIIYAKMDLSKNINDQM